MNENDPKKYNIIEQQNNKTEQRRTKKPNTIP